MTIATTSRAVESGPATATVTSVALPSDRPRSALTAWSVDHRW